jgi:hypothetical protein
VIPSNACQYLHYLMMWWFDFDPIISWNWFLVRKISLLNIIEISNKKNTFDNHPNHN